MKYLPYTLIVVLSSSLFVALVINPALAARYMKTEEDTVNRPKWTRIGAILAVLGLGTHTAIYLALGTPVGLPLFVATLANLFGYAGILILTYLWIFEPGTQYFQKSALPRLEQF